MPVSCPARCRSSASCSRHLQHRAESDIVSVASSSTNVELLRARAEHAKARLGFLEAEASSSRRSHRSQSSKGSGTNVPTSAGPAEVPRGLEAVPEDSAVRQAMTDYCNDSVERKLRLGQVEEQQPVPGAAQAAAGSGVPAEDKAPTDPRMVTRSTSWSTRTLSSWMPRQPK